VEEVPIPTAGPGEVLVRMLRAGICTTDREIVKGYVPFQGVMGHELLGVAESGKYAGQRVVADINVLCGDCSTCNLQGCDWKSRTRRRNHCLKRECLGIHTRQGCIAQWACLPEANLHPVPASVPDEVAVFAEPLAAALRIQEQELVGADDAVIILGDGKLALLVAEVLARVAGSVTIVGRHMEKMDLLPQNVAKLLEMDAKSRKGTDPSFLFDVAVDATGGPESLQFAAELVRPMGTVILKTTCAGQTTFDASLQATVKEVQIVGSRCGPIDEALKFMETHQETTALNLKKYITATFPLADAEAAFAKSVEKGALKVQVVMGNGLMAGA